MGRHIDHNTLLLWQYLVKSGGYSSLRYIRSKLFPGETSGVVNGMAARLLENGMVRRKSFCGEPPTFGVTITCAAPPGYSYLLLPQHPAVIDESLVSL